MAKIVVKIPHVAWRDGRPRFVPGAALRKMGYKGEDLKKPSGEWFTLSEAATWSEDFCRELEVRRAARAAGKKPRRPQKKEQFAVAHLMAAWLEMVEGRKTAETVGKRKVKPLAAKTISWHKNNSKRLQDYDEELWGSPAASITPPIAYGVYERLYEDLGLHNARALIATVRGAYSWGVKRGLVATNPWKDLGMQTPAPRQRVGSITEMVRFMATADAIGRPEIGDSVALGLFTGQRQGDRLRLAGGHEVDGRIILTQNKTKAIVSIRPLPQLVARLKAARARRKNLGVDFTLLVIDEVKKRPWPAEGTDYRRAFAAVRAAAVEGVKGQDGTWIVEPTPSLADFHDQDLRDTAVTWLANAECTVPEISAITGHSEVSIYQILKHYLARSPEQADSALRKLEQHLAAKNEGL